MSNRSIFAIIAIFLSGILLACPVFGQRQGEEIPNAFDNRDEAAIKGLLKYYEASFNERDIDWRMSLCLDTYHEYGFENGRFLQVRDYDETKKEVGGYWASIGELDYSMADIDVQLDGPMAFARTYTTHLAPNDHHSSIVYFTLVKIDGAWRIAWDSYDIVRRFDD